MLSRTRHRLAPDASRTVSRLFVPGQETLIPGGTVVLPYGCSDSSVRIASVDLAQLLAELTG
jgi:hypothetical protein